MVMNKILRCGGGNTYTILHAGNDAIICSQKQEIPLRLPCQAMHTDGTIERNVTKAYMEEGLAALNKVAPAPQGMILNHISTTLVVTASWPAVILAITIIAGDRTYMTDAAAAVEHGVQSNNLGDGFWNDFEERIKWWGRIWPQLLQTGSSMIK